MFHRQDFDSAGLPARRPTASCCRRATRRPGRWADGRGFAAPPHPHVRRRPRRNPSTTPLNPTSSTSSQRVPRAAGRSWPRTRGHPPAQPRQQPARDHSRTRLTCSLPGSRPTARSTSAALSTGTTCRSAKLKAFVLVPWHLAGALFGFLDAFSAFGRQPPSPPAARFPAAHSFTTFQGLPVHLEKCFTHGQEPDDVQLVPILERSGSARRRNHRRRHVVAFDVGPTARSFVCPADPSAGNPSGCCTRDTSQAVVII